MSSPVPDWTMRPALHDGDAVAELQRLVEVVADEDDGLVELLLEIEKLVLELVADQRIERRERLVHEQDVGVGGEGARQADALLHAAGKLVRVLVGPFARGPTSASFSSTIRSRSATATPRSSRPKPTFSRTVRQGSSANCWNTMETRARARRRAASRSSQRATSTVPALVLDEHLRRARPR